MNEQKWKRARNPESLMKLLLPLNPSERKLRLYAVACCRRIWDLMVHEDSRRSVIVGERYADGEATLEELQEANEAADVALGLMTEVAWYVEGDFDDMTPSFSTETFERQHEAIKKLEIPIDACGAAAEAAFHPSATESPYRAMSDMTAAWAYRDAAPGNTEKAEQIAQSQLLRDIFGNPFSPVLFDGSLRTSNVVAVAQRMYDKRDFSNMPFLGDALEEAGCCQTEILDHCRKGDIHVRGCWVVDRVLLKS